MNLSLNEVEAMAKRATRGAGHSWGMAEEASKATRWLCVQGLDGVAVLADVLKQTEATDTALTYGVALSDHAADLSGSAKVFAKIENPEMFLPFAAMVARQLGKPVRLECSEFAATTDGAGLAVVGTCPSQVEDLTVCVVAEMGQPRPQSTRAAPASAAWTFLNELAHLTYAPATEESRRLGAGAGLSDND